MSESLRVLFGVLFVLYVVALVVTDERGRSPRFHRAHSMLALAMGLVALASTFA